MQFKGGLKTGYNLISDKTQNSMLCWLDGKISQSNPETGSIWYDLSGNNNDLSIISGTIELNTSGLSLSNDINNITNINPNLLDISDYTIEFYVYKNYSFPYLLVCNEGTGRSDFSDCRFYNSELSVVIYNLSGTKIFNDNTRPDLQQFYIYYNFQVGRGLDIAYNNQWNHIVLTYNNSSKQFYGYCNGKKTIPYLEMRYSGDSTINYTNNGVIPSYIDYTPPSNVFSHITLGGLVNLGMTGIFNLFRVYSRPLTDSEVLHNYYALNRRSL